MRIGSILVAFITSPFTLSLPLMYSFCAFALPAMSFANWSSAKMRLTERLICQPDAMLQVIEKGNLPPGFLPSGARPLPTVPVSFRSMCQLSCSPCSFFSVKAKMAPPFWMASLRSASLERADAIASKAADEGQASLSMVSLCCKTCEI